MTKQPILLLAISLLGLLLFSCGRNTANRQQETTVTEESATVDEIDEFPQGEVDIDTYMALFDRMVEDLSRLKILEAADTLKLNALEEKYAVFDDIVIQGDPEEMTHSQRLHYLRSLLDYFNEFERIGTEMKAAGIENAERMLPDQDMLDAKELLEKEYERESR